MCEKQWAKQTNWIFVYHTLFYPYLLPFIQHTMFFQTGIISHVKDTSNSVTTYNSATVIGNKTFTSLVNISTL
jgi:hypothetical protein